MTPADRVRQHGQNECQTIRTAKVLIDTSGSDEKTRLEINFHQPNKSMNILIQSDIYLQMAANWGIRENYHQQRQDIMDPGAFLPIAKNPQIVRAAQLAVLELLKQPKRSDLS